MVFLSICHEHGKDCEKECGKSVRKTVGKVWERLWKEYGKSVRKTASGTVLKDNMEREYRKTVWKVNLFVFLMDNKRVDDSLSGQISVKIGLLKSFVF